MAPSRPCESMAYSFDTAWNCTSISYLRSIADASRTHDGHGHALARQTFLHRLETGAHPIGLQRYVGHKPQDMTHGLLRGIGHSGPRGVAPGGATGVVPGEDWRRSGWH